MQFIAVPGVRLVVVALSLAAAPLAAAAEEPAGTGAPLDAGGSAVLAQALDASPASPTAPERVVRGPAFTTPAGLAISGDRGADGSGNVAIKQSLPTGWDTKVGVDLNVAAPPPVSYTPDGPLPGSQTGASSGSAWASAGVPNLAKVDARIDPGDKQGHVATTLQHSLPIGGDFSVTLRDRFAVSDTVGSPDAAAPVWSNERGVKFNILPTGTTLAANLASASDDPTTHNTLSAEQKLYGPLHVTTTVSDIGEPTVNKSITAGLKFKW